MDSNNLYIAVAIIVIFGFYTIYRYGSFSDFIHNRKPEDNESDLLITENNALYKKIDVLESTLKEKEVLISEILSQKRSYETMDKYIQQLENTIQNLQPLKEQEKSTNE